MLADKTMVGNIDKILPFCVDRWIDISRVNVEYLSSSSAVAAYSQKKTKTKYMSIAFPIKR